MASVLHRITKQYFPFANTPDYSLVNWIINPDLAAIEGFPPKYWIIAGDTVTLMSPAERDSVDLVEVETIKNNLSTNLDRVLKALIISLNDGTFIPASGYTNPVIKQIIKDHL